MLTETKLSKKVHSLASQLRTIETDLNRNLNSNDIVSAWFILPVRKLIVSIGLYIFTVFSVIFSPWNIYGEKLADNFVFIRGRAFALSSIALYELVGGQFVYFSGMDNISDSMLKTIVKTASSAFSLIYMLFVIAVNIYVCSHVAKAPLTFSNSTRAASYGLGSFPLAQLIIGLFPFGIVYSFGDTLPNGNISPALFGVISILVVLGTFFLLYVIIFAPIKIQGSSTSNLRLLVGWFCGWLLAMLLFAAPTFAINHLFPGITFKIGFK